jgi:polysaccharide deacetylase 2 family uncharacterized protein YibQ
VKKRSKKKAKLIFWLIFALGCLWVAFMPHKHVLPPNAVTVKVQPVEEAPPPLPVEKPPVSGGEEQTLPSTPQSENVIVPVVPEKQDTVVSGRPRIAIVIDDVGVDLKGSERAIKLPAPITLSFLPYAVRLREQAKEAQANGHEMLLHMPMEPIGHEDPGPGALLVDLPMRDLQQRFENALASFTGFDGVNNHMGSKFTAYADGMTMVMDELGQRHLFFLDSRTSAQSVGKQIAEQKHIPTIGRDVFLDDVQTPDAIRAQLAETERVARHKGYAVAIGHPHAATMDVMEVWVAEAQKQGFDLVPLHSLVKK